MLLNVNRVVSSWLVISGNKFCFVYAQKGKNGPDDIIAQKAINRVHDPVLGKSAGNGVAQFSYPWFQLTIIAL